MEDYMEKFDYLDSYIENCIEYHSTFRRKVDSETLEEYYEQTLPLTFIEKRSFSEEEIEYIFDYLSKKDIIVVGDSPVVYCEFENYRYVRDNNPINLNLYEKYDEEKCNELIYKYKTMKVETEEEKLEKDELKKRIVSMNMGLVLYVVNNFNRSNNYNDDELVSYGYEGLLRSVDKFSLDREKFSTFAVHYIQGYILSGIPKILGFSEKNFYYDFLNAKKILERKTGKKIDDYIEKIDDIVSILAENEKQGEEIKRRVFLTNLLSLDELEDKVYDDNTLYNESLEKVYTGQMKKEIEKILNKLNFCQKQTLIKRYGLDGNEPKKLRIIADEENVSFQNIANLEKRAINNLKSISTGLLEYYEGLHEYEYNPTGIEEIKVKQKLK